MLCNFFRCASFLLTENLCVFIDGTSMSWSWLASFASKKLLGIYQILPLDAGRNLKEKPQG
jgi:hypothetical protein